jgi:hypothetical protein
MSGAALDDAAPSCSSLTKTDAPDPVAGMTTPIQTPLEP